MKRCVLNSCLIESRLQVETAAQSVNFAYLYTTVPIGTVYTLNLTAEVCKPEVFDRIKENQRQIQNQNDSGRPSKQQRRAT